MAGKGFFATEITLSIHYLQNFKMAAKNGIKQFWEKGLMALQITSGQKFNQNHSILHCFPDKYIFAFYTEFQGDHQKWQENVFGKKLPDDSVDSLGVKNFMEIAVSCTILEITVLLHLHRNSKMTAKSCGKKLFGIKWQMTIQSLCGSTILSKSLYLTPFQG